MCFQSSISGVTAAYNREQLWLANEGLITKLQACCRGYLVRQEFRSRMNFLKKQIPAITCIQVFQSLLCADSKGASRAGLMNSQRLQSSAWVWWTVSTCSWVSECEQSAPAVECLSVMNSTYSRVSECDEQSAPAVECRSVNSQHLQLSVWVWWTAPTVECLSVMNSQSLQSSVWVWWTVRVYSQVSGCGEQSEPTVECLGVMNSQCLWSTVWVGFCLLTIPFSTAT